MKAKIYRLILPCCALLLISFWSSGQISVSSPSSGATVSQCGTYILRFAPGTGFSGNAAAEVHLDNSSGAIVQTLGYPSGYLSMNYDNVVSAGTLTPGNNYQIKVYDGYNSSNFAWSGIFSVTSLTAPTSISLTANYYDWIEINWPPVSGASGYYVDVSTASDFSSGNIWVDHLASGTDPYGLYVSGLPSGTTYYCRIKSTGSCGTTGESGTYSFSTLTCTPPAVPTANAATTVKSTSFVANWSSVAGATNGYDIIVTRSGFSPETYTAASGTSKTISPLHPSSSYSYTVKAKGCSASSESNSISLSTTALGVPGISGASAAGGTGQPFEWTVNWGNVDGATTYQFQMSLYPTFSSISVDVMSSDETESFEGNQCSTYYVRIRSKCATGEFSAYCSAFELEGLECRMGMQANTEMNEKSGIGMDQGISISPNPVESLLTVKLPNKINTEALSVTVSDMTGMVIAPPIKISGGYAEVDISGVASGLYVISLGDGIQKRRSKFIKR